MRTTIVAATFLLVGAGAVSAGALNGIHLKGSDTLFEVTTAILNGCSGANGSTGLVYDGTGSGNGEAAMVAGTQSIAPMSRFLKKNTSNAAADPCLASGSGGTPATAEGLVLGLDGISIIGAKDTLAAGSGGLNCNGADLGCTRTEVAGLAYAGHSQAIAGMTVGGWRDVLKVLLGGVTPDGVKNCNSASRIDLAGRFYSIFAQACGSGACNTTDAGKKLVPGIRHIFRRDDASGTTDVMVGLLGLSSISLPGNTSPFCNALTPAQIDTLNAAGKHVLKLTPDSQDFDPIRRPCASDNDGSPSSPPTTTLPTEQVCSRKGDLGLVLVIPAVDKFANYPYVSGLTPDDVTFKNLANPLAQRDLAYPLNPCAGKGLFANAPMDTAGNRDRCPNGDVTVFGSQCLVNADANSVMPCLGGSLQKPAFVFDDTPVDGMAPSASDGRVYNLIGYANDSSGNPQLLKDSRGREVTGLFGRIHTYRSMNEPDSSLPASTGGYTGVCRDLDATSQIGCLMTASKCSLGYAGREAVAQYPNAVSIKVNAVPDQAACLANLSYSLTRKLYLNTMLGFGNARLATQETALAACFVQNPNAATGINTVIGDKGFLPLPSTPAGAVYCEDFNENMICGGAANVNACAPASNPTWFPSVSTICGNGIVETLEECDWGLTPTTCDKTCRLL